MSFKYQVAINWILVGLTLSTENLSAATQDRIPGDGNVANRFVVTLIEKDERHPWFGRGFVGRGHEIAFSVDGVPGKELTLVRGQTYEFDIRSNPMHDFYLSTSPVGRGRDILVKGVEGNYTYDGIVTFKPTAATPSVVYYQCQNHTYMGGVIYIVDHPDETPQRAAVEEASSEIIKEPEMDPETLIKTVTNKIAFATLSIRTSSGAKRVAQSDHADAKSMLSRANELISDAQGALNAGDAAHAEELIDDAIRTSSTAFQLVPDPAEARRKAKSAYTNLLRSVDSALLSYQSYEHIERADKSEGAAISEDKIREDIAKAERLASDEDFDAAARLLLQTQKTLDNALATLLDAQTITYELHFATPEDEYRYEQRRNQEYGRLLTAVVERLDPPKSKMSLINMLSEQGDRLRKNAEESAVKGKFDFAIETLQTSTSRYQQAIRMAGIQVFGR